MSDQFLKLRRSSVPGKVPSTSSIDYGELAMNTYDGLLFMKKSGSRGEEVIPVGSSVKTYPSRSLFPSTGSEDVIYIDSQYDVQYYWTSSMYVATDIVFSNGLTPIKRIPTAGLNVSKVSVKDWLSEVFYPFISATLSLNGFSYVETGSVYTPQLVGTLTLNDETIVNSRIVQVNGVDVSTFPTNNINQAAPSSITIDTTYRLKANVDNSGSPTNIFSSNQSVPFVYPYFYGTGPDSSTIQSSNLYSYGTKVVSTGAGSLSINFNASTPTYLWFAHDASISTKTTWYVNALNNGSIGGPTNLFGDPITINITSTTTNTWTRSYKVYITNFATAQTSTMILS